MKRILSCLFFLGFGLISFSSFADDINFLLSNRVDIAQGSGRPQILFIIDVLEQSSVTKTGETSSEGWNEVNESSPGTFAVSDVATTPLLIQYPNDISFTGTFIGTNGSLSYRYYEVSSSTYDEIVTKDPREIVKYIMRTRPDLEYGLISLNEYTNPDSYLTSADLKLEVDHRSDVTTSFATIDSISSHSSTSTPITGGISVAYDYLIGQLDDGGGSNYASPLSNDCSDVKLILITNGGWTNDINYATTSSLRTAVTSELGNTSSISAYLVKVAEYIRNYEFKTDCDARISTSVYGVGAETTENLFSGSDPVGNKVATAGDGIFLNADTGGEIVRSVLEDLDHSYPDPLSISSPSVAVSVNRAAHKPTAYATAFEPLKTQRWYGNITDKDLSDSDDDTLDPIGGTTAGSKTFANGFIATKTAASRNIKTNIANGNSLVSLSSIVGSSDTIITSDDYNSYVKDLPGGLADPIHFKPLAIDYGGSTGTRLVIGTNDGLLHMFDASGNELWAFLPKEMEKLVPALANGNTAPSYMMVDHFYGVDGAPTVFVYDAPDSDGIRDGEISSASGSKDKVFLYFGLRRGGGTYYAMDITNPAAPSLLWTKGSMSIDYGAEFDVDVSDAQRENESSETVITAVEPTGSGCPVFATFYLNGSMSSLVMGVCNGAYTSWCLWKYGDYNRGLFSGEVLLDGSQTYSKQEPSVGIYAYYNGPTDYGFTQKNQCVWDLSGVNQFTFDAHPMAIYSYEVTSTSKNSTCSSTYFASIANNMFLGKDNAGANTEVVVGFDITSIPHNAYITSARISLVHSSDGDSESDVYDGAVSIDGVNGYFGEAPGQNAYSTQDCTDKDAYYGDYHHVYENVGGIGDPGSYSQERTIDGYIFPEDLYGEFYTSGKINDKGILALTKLFKSSTLHDTIHDIAWAQFKMKIADPSGVSAGSGAIFETPTGGPQIERQMYGDDYWDNVVPKLEVTWTYDAPSGTITNAEMTKSDATFLAVRGNGAVISYTVTASAGANGSVSPTSATVASGATTQITVTADSGYEIDSVTGCSGSLSGTTYTTGAVSADCTVSATFSLIPVTTYTVTANAGANGSVSPTSATVDSGNTADITVTPDSGYEIDSVSGCGTGTLSGNTYTTGAVTENCTVSATFVASAVTTYTATGVAGAGGSISVPAIVDEGLSAQFMITPDSGYQIDSVGGCGAGSLSGNIYTTGAITADCTVSVTFSLIPATAYTVSTSAGSNGSISPTSASVAEGSTKQFTITPDTGYQIAGASGCGGSLSGSTYTTGAINSACTVSATFEVIPPTMYTVSTSAGSNGSISPTSASVEEGNTKQFTITPDSGYQIAGTSGCGGSLSGSTYTTGAINSACTVAATFEAEPSGATCSTSASSSNSDHVSAGRASVTGDNNCLHCTTESCCSSYGDPIWLVNSCYAAGYMPAACKTAKNTYTSSGGSSWTDMPSDSKVLYQNENNSNWYSSQSTCQSAN